MAAWQQIIYYRPIGLYMLIAANAKLFHGELSISAGDGEVGSLLAFYNHYFVMV